MPAWIGRGCVKYLIRAESSLRETIDGDQLTVLLLSLPYPLPRLSLYLSSFLSLSRRRVLPPSSYPRPGSANAMTRGAIMSTSFQDSFTPPFELYRSEPLVSPSLFQRDRPLSYSSISARLLYVG